jgi:aminopeptidase N
MEQDYAGGIVDKAEALNDAIEEAKEYASYIDEVSDFDYTSNLDELTEEALDYLLDNLPDTFDIQRLTEAARDIETARQELKDAIESARDNLPKTYEVVVRFTVEGKADEDAAEKVVQEHLGNHLRGPVYIIDEVREA